MRALCLFALFVSTAHADRYDPIGASLGRLRAAAKCDDKASPWRPWCIAADYDAGKVAELPAKNLVGLTVELEDGRDSAAALRDRVSLVALAVAHDGGRVKVKLTDITPSNDDERPAIAEAVAAVALVLKGKAKTAELRRDLGAYIGGLPASYDAAKGELEWAWTGKNPSTARKVGDFWVVIEIEQHGKGIWATVLTDRWSAKPR